MIYYLYYDRINRYFRYSFIPLTETQESMLNLKHVSKINHRRINEFCEYLNSYEKNIFIL